MSERHPLDIGENLWEEWKRQQSLTRAAGRAKADAKHALSQAKAQLKVLGARLKLRIRTDPKEFGLDKITEDAVKSAMEVSGEYREMEAKIRRLEWEEDICSVEVSANVDRRKALENMVQLLSIEYHSEREPRPLSPAAAEELRNRQKRVVRSVIDEHEIERD
jgi:hypothetical protein